MSKHGAHAEGQPADAFEAGAAEIRRDARRELRLIPQAIFALVIVTAVAVIRELVLR